MITDEQAIATLRVAMEAENSGVTCGPIGIGPYSLYLVISAIQMTCTHPNITPELVGHYRQIAGALAGALPPSTRQVSDLGWHTRGPAFAVSDVDERPTCCDDHRHGAVPPNWPCGYIHHHQANGGGRS